MEFEIYNPKDSSNNKLMGYIYATLIILIIGDMISGVGTHQPFFERFNVPVWMYVVSIIITVVLIILIFNILSDEGRSVIEFNKENAKIFKRSTLKLERDIRLTKNVKIEMDFSVVSPDHRMPWKLIAEHIKIIFLVEPNRTEELREFLKRL